MVMTKARSTKSLLKRRSKSRFQIVAKRKLVEHVVEKKRGRAATARKVHEAKAAARAAGKERQILALGRGRAVRQQDSPMPSSWVDKIGYDPSTMTLSAVFNGEQLFWRPIHKAVYDIWREALSTCKTNDPTGQNRWKKGKIPSLGATWWKKIMKHIKGKRVII